MLPTNRQDLVTASAFQKFKYLFFYGHKTTEGDVTKACFSQWYEAPFIVDGIQYLTAEHFMMAEKARLFHDEETLVDILSAGDPSTAKAYGRSVQNFDDEIWCKHRFDIVIRGNLAKFGQNPDLKRFLLGTKHHVLVEASPRDRIWGIGLSSNNPNSENPILWRGRNLLGFALMVVRDRLLELEVDE